MMKDTQQTALPPAAKKITRETQVHGALLKDDYFWMRERANPEVLDYLKAENAYLESVLKPTEPLQKKLYEEMLSRIKETDLSVPVKRGNYYYYSRTEKGLQYPLYTRKKGSLDAPEELLLDLNLLAGKSEYFSLGAFGVSPDHQLLAYSTDFTGDETYPLHIKDLKTGNLLSDTIPNTASGIVWAEDNRTLFYTTLDEMKRP